MIGMTRSAIEAIKDEAHERLLGRREIDEETDCWIYTGAWQSETGLGMIRVLGKQFTVSRVAAWIYKGGFFLWDMRVRVYHSGCCGNPACFNPDHLSIARSPGKMNTALARLGRFGPRRQELLAC